ncbi:SURP and G-patch domain-containing protein 2 [Bufo bufo]|uniref:SURP and G-patch domain-containing protein 2 n=1 Tax=Bufo bufo TaxID=8384 RepID=UPI001ABE1F39|nr:SURP and G-patch domain-containing protein 2 [Bufo bufo]XP_040273359.1 SURP and G-patch domain-containing protein 2 [Bufo bufo]
MSGQRMTREAFDAIVQEKMKRYRVSMDQAMSDTLRELDGPSSSRRPVNDMDALYRDKQRYPMHDVPYGSVDGDWDMEMRRDGISNQPYRRELDRELSGGRNFNPLLDRWGPNDPIVKERLYREELHATNRQLGELENLRDLSLSRKNWDLDHPLREPEHPMDRAEIVRDLRSRNEFGKGVFEAHGALEHVAIRRGQKKGNITQHAHSFAGRPAKGGEPSTKQDELDKDQVFNIGLQIVKWAKFDSAEDMEFLKQYASVFKVKTDACKMLLDCLKCKMAVSHREMCFSSVRTVVPPVMRSPRIDNDLLDLLVRTRTVKTKNDFFNAIKPFDMEMMLVQKNLLHCITPLLLACNAYEIKHFVLTDPRELFVALKSTVLLCRQSLVLIGQTFAMISGARQNNVLNLLSVSDPNLKPIDFPNFKSCFLFGGKFVSRLTTWLQNKDNKLILKSQAKVPDDKKVPKKQSKPDGESQEKKAADVNAIATIDQLFENAKKGNQAAGAKSQFGFLFDEGSNEYKYYRQKFVEFQESKNQIQTQSTQTKSCKRSPEELATDSVRAMLYARKVQNLKKKLFRTLAFSRKRKQAKLKRRVTKEMPSVEEEKKVEEQELKSIPVEETTPETSACEVDVKSEKIPDTCSVSSSSPAQKVEEKVEEKEPVATEPLDVDEKTKDTAIKLAEFVAQMGPEIEQFSMENSVNNPEFWFLCDKESPAYKFYRSKVEEFKQTEEAMSDNEEIGLEDCDLENIRTGDEPQNDSDVEIDAECEAAEALSTESAPVAAFSQMPTPARPPIARKRVANLKVGLLPPKRVCLVEEPKIHDPVRIEYERPRGRSRHRMKKPVDLQYANKKITQQNVGFKMLSKMGWQEGQGLGSRGSGIKNPINVGTISAGEGLGAEEKKSGNSANFDAFRQRMIEMYKQKITK